MIISRLGTCTLFHIVKSRTSNSGGKEANTYYVKNTNFWSKVAGEISRAIFLYFLLYYYFIILYD